MNRCQGIAKYKWRRVVCPVSLVSQWASEIEKMAVGLRVIQHHGPSRTSSQFILTLIR